MSISSVIKGFLASGCSRPYRYLWVIWFVGFGALIIAVSFSSYVQKRPLETAIYVAAIGLLPPFLILAYAYLVESGEIIIPARRPLSSQFTTAERKRHVKAWQKWSSINTRSGKASAIAPELVKCHESCTICLGTFEDDDEIRELPCKHVLHESCFKACFYHHTPFRGKLQHECPLCRAVVGPVYDQCSG